MKIKKQDKDNICIYDIEGRLDVIGAAMLHKVLEGTVAEGQPRIVLNMEKVDYLNSDVLHILADVQTRTRQQGGDLRIIKFSPMVQRVFEIAGFKKFFPVYGNLQSALNGF